MTNYEKEKGKIEAIAEKGYGIAINKKTGEISCCGNTNCNLCLFQSADDSIHCQANAMKWAAAEYIEPEIDWSKVPVDTPVLISEDGVDWSRRHFAGVIDGEPFAYLNGGTSWSADKNSTIWCRYIKLAELPHSPETEE